MLRIIKIQFCQDANISKNADEILVRFNQKGLQIKFFLIYIGVGRGGGAQ